MKVQLSTTEEQRKENALADKIGKKWSGLLPNTRSELEPYRFRDSRRLIAGLKQEPLMTPTWRIERICAMVRDGSAAISTLMLLCGQHLSFSRERSVQWYTHSIFAETCPLKSTKVDITRIIVHMIAHVICHDGVISGRRSRSSSMRKTS